MIEMTRTNYWKIVEQREQWWVKVKKKKETGKITRREENGKADRKEKSIRMIWEREMRKAWLKEMQSCTNFEIQFNNLTVNDTIVLKIELIFVWKIGNHWKSLGQSIVAV